MPAIIYDKNKFFYCARRFLFVIGFHHVESSGAKRRKQFRRVFNVISKLMYGDCKRF